MFVQQAINKVTVRQMSAMFRKCRRRHMGTTPQNIFRADFWYTIPVVYRVIFYYQVPEINTQWL